jgi:hypothetical protein
MEEARRGMLTPDGKAGIYAEGDNIVICNDVGWATRKVTLRDLTDGSTISEIEQPGHVVSPVAVSPDGTELLVQVYLVDGTTPEGLPCWTWMPDSPVLLWQDGALNPARTYDVLRSWGSNLGIELSCGGVLTPWQGGRVDCDDGSEATIIAEGHEVDSMRFGHILGVIPAAAP